MSVPWVATKCWQPCGRFKARRRRSSIICASCSPRAKADCRDATYSARPRETGTRAAFTSRRRVSRRRNPPPTGDGGLRCANPPYVRLRGNERTMCATRKDSVIRLAAMLLVAVTACAGAPSRADDVGAFYKGKRINLIVSYGPGGGYDVYARVLARHIGKYIPGNPTIVVQNMPGAGSVRGA